MQCSGGRAGTKRSRLPFRPAALDSPGQDARDFPTESPTCIVFPGPWLAAMETLDQAEFNGSFPSPSPYLDLGRTREPSRPFGWECMGSQPPLGGGLVAYLPSATTSDAQAVGPQDPQAETAVPSPLQKRLLSSSTTPSPSASSSRPPGSLRHVPHPGSPSASADRPFSAVPRPSSWLCLSSPTALAMFTSASRSSPTPPFPHALLLGPLPGTGKPLRRLMGGAGPNRHRPRLDTPRGCGGGARHYPWRCPDAPAGAPTSPGLLRPVPRPWRPAGH